MLSSCVWAGSLEDREPLSILAIFRKWAGSLKAFFFKMLFASMERRCIFPLKKAWKTLMQLAKRLAASIAFC